MPFARPVRSTTQRGYGHAHRKARTAYLAALTRDGIGRCAIGGEAIHPEQAHLPRTHPRALCLDHDPRVPGTYRGLACREHNVSDGARRARSRQQASRLAW